jgi:hypothetical protein
MAIVTCTICEQDWAASAQPCCPRCLLTAWLASPTLITEKHDPAHLERVHHEYRSILTEEVAGNLGAFLADAVQNGTWYYNTEYERYNHVTRMPLQRKPGAGVGSGATRLQRRLEDLVVADADGAPHVFADDRNETRRKIARGIYLPLDACARANCDNVSQPGFRECAVHVDPPRAVPGFSRYERR